MMDGRPSTLRESLGFWCGIALACLPGIALYAAAARWAGLLP